MKVKRESSLLLVLALVSGLLVQGESANASGCSGFGGGSGTSEADPFIISTANHLRGIALCDGTSRFFSIRADIDLGDVPFTPLGSVSTAPFQSKIFGEVLDGGQTRSARITGLNVNTTVSGFVAFAGAGSALRNLDFSGAITSPAATGQGFGTGLIAVARPANNGTITLESVTTAIDINSKATRGVGGLVGWFAPAGTGKGPINLLISDSHVVVQGSKGSIIAQDSGELGGLVGYSSYGAIQAFGSSVTVAMRTERPGAGVGGMFATLINSSLTLKNARSAAVIDYSPETEASSDIGGLVGSWTSMTEAPSKNSLLESSSFVGLISFRGGGDYGGLVGYVPAVGTALELTIRDSYSSGTIRRDPTVMGSAAVNIGGLIGHAATSMTLQRVISNTDIDVLGGERVGGIFGRVTENQPLMTGVFFNSSVEATNRNQSAGNLDRRVSVPSQFSTVGQSSAISSFSLSDQVTITTNFSSSTWSYSVGSDACAVPYLSWEGSNGCQPKMTGVVLSQDGLIAEVFFSSPVNATGDPRFPSPSVFVMEKNGTSINFSQQIQAGASSRSVTLELPSPIVTGDRVVISYVDPDPSNNNDQSISMQSELAGQLDVESRAILLFPALGPSSLLSQLISSPTSVNANLTCSGSCGAGDSYTYVASITPAGGSTTTISGTATSAITTLSFPSLTPNVTHTIRASVTHNGQTSATVSTTVTTSKPIATISALTVADTSATLAVGCTNCGANPDSFTVSATPLGGGSAITSNTNVISGLQSETTYSFAVVVAFAGTTSDSVNWQSNPVRTLPFVPIISEVSPTAVPLTGGAITVTGSNFTTSTELSLGGNTLSFTIVNGSTITFTAPNDLAGVYDLAITNPVGTYTLSNAITYVPGPSLSTNSPVVATTNGGTIVTLTGTNLATTTQVNVGSTTVSFSVVSDTTVRFVTAATSAGIVDVGVVTVGGADTLSNAIEFTTSALVPVVSSITPATGPVAGGTTVTVTGQYFSGSYSDSVSAAINGVSGSSLVLIDDSTLTFVTPAGSAGAYDLSVVTGGGVGTLLAAFTYTAPPPAATGGGSGTAVVLNTPEILKFSTRELSVAGGQVIAEGRRLAGVTELSLGGIAVTIVSNTDTTLVFLVRNVPAGTWDLRLVGSNGTLTFQQAITVVEAQIVTEASSGTLLGYTWTLRFSGNSRALNSAQEDHLLLRLNRFDDAETIICWGYTTASTPNAWAIAHATARAKAACDFASANNSGVKTVVRLRYGVEKNFAMRSALQFWK